MAVIDDIIKSQVIERVCRTFAGDLADDLIQEMYLTFLSMKPAKLQKLWDTNFDWYVIRSVTNAMYNDSYFRRTHSPSREMPTNEMPSKTYNGHDQIIDIVHLNHVIEALDKMHWYNKRLFYMYIEEGTYRAIEKETGIHYISVYKTVKMVREALKKQFNEDTDINGGT